MAILGLIRISYIFCKYRLDELFDPLVNKVLLSLLFLLPRIFFRKQKEIEHRLSDALEEMGPLFIKFGQLLSTRPDLVGEKQAKVLKKFQNNLKPFSTREAIKIVEQDLESPINQIFESFSGADSLRNNSFRKELLNSLKPELKTKLLNAFDKSADYDYQDFIKSIVNIKWLQSEDVNKLCQILEIPIHLVPEYIEPKPVVEFLKPLEKKLKDI